MRSMMRIYSMQMGAANPKNMLTMRLNLPEQKYPNADGRLRFYEQLQTKLASVPGVQSVAIASHLPVNGLFDWDFQIEGQPPVEKGKRPSTGGVVTSPGYFQTLGTKLIGGRTFTEQDGLPGRTVAIVNQCFAAKYFANQDPVGRRIRLLKDDKKEEPWLTIVGVSPDVRQNNPMDDHLETVVYVPLRQDTPQFINVMARTSVQPSTLATAFRKQVQELDQDLPAFGVRSLKEQFAQQRWAFRVFGSIFVGFSIFALALSALGIYAVIDYSMNQRTPEIGLRVALGVSTMNVMRLVLSKGALQLGIGLALGLAGSFAITRFIKAILVDVSPTDPLTFGVVAGLLILAAALASVVPARRAARVDPVIALRYE